MPTITVKGSKSDRLLLSPQEALVAGGPAEELERRIQEVFKLGYEHVVIDLRGLVVRNINMDCWRVWRTCFLPFNGIKNFKMQG